MTRDDFSKQNGIDPAEPAFVRLSRAELDRGRAPPDGFTTVELELADGRPHSRTVALDSTGSIALMERVQADFARISFETTCTGTVEVVGGLAGAE